MPLTITINGQPRKFVKLDPGCAVAELIAEMDLKGDRVAVELNHQIAPRTQWEQLRLQSGDRLEIVHFVGGGCR
ncbi:MAG TPA: sulfur carrier protein ThiS [Acidobacteriaceae bacterium]|nr:sulfur carrier protein ThiS [Acidobacteriaceae bacterium]